ncbi:MAG: hypothetical protein K2Z81_03670 [Cyanobacteria bacterium]|nr:hypothetical protein [Cyanobacteriota bacterium]
MVDILVVVLSVIYPALVGNVTMLLIARKDPVAAKNEGLRLKMQAWMSAMNILIVMTVTLPLCCTGHVWWALLALIAGAFVLPIAFVLTTTVLKIIAGAHQRGSIWIADQIDRIVPMASQVCRMARSWIADQLKKLVQIIDGKI